MGLHEVRDQCAVLDMPRQTVHVYVSHLIVFYQCHKEPEGDLFTAVEQQCADDEVHPLDVADTCIVLGESLQDSLETLLPFTGRLLENLLLRERPGDIALNLSLLPHTDEVLHSKETQVALPILLDLKLPPIVGQL